MSVAERLKQHLGEGFLGLREDRGEVTAWVAKARWVEAARFLKDQTSFSVFCDLTAVDYLDREPRFDLTLHLLSHQDHEGLRLKTLVEEEPEVETLTGVWRAANWYERELYDLFGFRFAGHPSLTRILLPPDYHGHPLRKDYPVTGPATSVYR